jgi:hypothetical protein
MVRHAGPPQSDHPPAPLHALPEGRIRPTEPDDEAYRTSSAHPGILSTSAIAAASSILALRKSPRRSLTFAAKSLTLNHRPRMSINMQIDGNEREPSSVWEMPITQPERTPHGHRTPNWPTGTQ